MQRFTIILFSPVGRSDNPAAIRRVMDLARRNGARLTLLGTVPEPSRRHRMLSSAVLDAAIGSAARHDMTEPLERWCETADGVDIDIDVQTGNAALTVIGQVLASGHDLVVVTSDEDSEDHATSKRLVRKCPCPVWVIRPTRARIQRVLVAVDPEPDEVELDMGTVARTGISGLVMGNTAEQILDDVGCSVIAVRVQIPHRRQALMDLAAATTHATHAPIDADDPRLDHRTKTARSRHRPRRPRRECRRTVSEGSPQ